MWKRRPLVADMRVVEGRAFFRGSIEECCIGITDGRISDIKKILKGDEHHNFGNNYILPSGTDVHVHFREPGRTHKEDFHSGTEGAACGGVTTVFDMPNNDPSIVDIQTYGEKCRTVGNKANVDFGLYVALKETSNTQDLSRLGCPFKVYMTGTAAGLGFGEYDKLGEICDGVGEARHIGIHCEDKGLVQPGERDLKDFLRLRPNEAEVSAIKRVAASTSRRIHICHVSARESIPLLENPMLTSEVTPHHMLLNVNSDLGGFGKANPPLRTKSDQMAMWEAFVSGKIDIIASDHAPHTIEEKEQSFDRAPSGVPGVETSIPLMLSQVKKGNLPIERLVSSMMERPAEMMGLNKGRIEVGMDADLIAVDMRNISEIRGDDLHSKCGWTPFEGWEAIFPMATFLRGELVAKESEMQETRRGKLILENEKP
jgi:dihydroorotase